MNERQRAKFEKWADYCDGTPFELERLSARFGYERACQDEAERAQGLVEALEHVLEDDDLVPRATSQCRKVVAAALLTYKGDAK